MQTITIGKANLRAVFTISDSGVVELAHFAPASLIPDHAGTTIPEKKPGEDEEETGWDTEVIHPVLEIQETGKSTRGMHGYKHNQSSASADFRYKNHIIEDNDAGTLLRIFLETPEDVRAVYHMQFFDGIPVVRVWTTLENHGNKEVPLEYISSFIYQNLCGGGTLPYYRKTDIYVPRSSWSSEANWQKYDARDLNLSGMAIEGYHCPGHGLNEFSYSGKSSWSSVDYLPMGLIHDRETDLTYCFQIEHSGQWHVEYGSDYSGRLYVALSGATEQEHGWWIRLSPGDSYTTVPVGFGAVQGDISDAVGALTMYRRAIRRPNDDDRRMNVIFNDYMNCLEGDPTEEKEKRIIDLAAEIGCEYYCMDAGWYDSGFWWDRVGEWLESPERFPSGLRRVYDYAKSKGLKMGMWLEIEVMGVKCPLAQTLPDDWFVCRHGRRHVDNKRYLLDFRNPAVRRYCDSVIDRLIDDYGCSYFKIDYNVSMGYGSDLYTDSCAEAIRQHYESLYQWYRGVFERHPDLVIENCGSGGMRMDYGMLSLMSLQSTSDQTDYLHNSYIAANVASAVAPEQAGMWVYPYVDDREHVIYNFVNGLLLRPYISGLVWNMSPENLKLMAEGISLYKKIRKDIAVFLPFFPLGFASHMRDRTLAYGVTGEHKAYLAVLTPCCDQAQIPLRFDREITSVSVIYPGSVDCAFSLRDNVLHVRMPQKAAARLFEITF